MTGSPPETRASLLLRMRDPANVAAWDQFLELYAPAIYRTARNLGLQAADADDVVQEVLAAVAQSVSDWIDRQDRGPFRAWLFRMARNKAIDYLTRRKHRVWAIGGEEAAQLMNEVAAAADIPSQVDAEICREIFGRAAELVRSKFSETTWQSFHRTTILGEPIQQVASQLGVSVGSIYIARSRVMKRLREAVKSLEERSDDEV
ncbi:RNA polymerase sigma factor [Planctomycetaceae bacterium SH139]